MKIRPLYQVQRVIVWSGKGRSLTLALVCAVLDSTTGGCMWVYSEKEEALFDQGERVFVCVSVKAMVAHLANYLLWFVPQSLHASYATPQHETVSSRLCTCDWKAKRKSLA